MTAAEILDKWAKYSDYDPDQKQFNLLSANYQMHHACNAIRDIMDYDPSGTIGCLYAKISFLKICQEFNVRLLDILANPDDWREDKEMWDIFHSEDFQRVEKDFLDRVDSIVTKVIPTKQLGSRDVEQEKESMYESISAVVEELSHCHVDVFLKGGPIQTVQHYDTHIHVFERLSECLLALEQARDGMYLCYINNYQTADGWFGFFIKSNGTILSVNERVDERFPGQHGISRNGRWSDAKKYQLFPYQFMFDFAEHDYKGYASKHIINDEKLAFFALDAKAYMPLILAMVMLNTKYQGMDISEEQVHFVDSLLKVNVSSLPVGQSTALVVPENSAIAAMNRSLEFTFADKDIMDGSAGQKFASQGAFPQEENIFATLYGDGFHLDASRLLEADPALKALPADQRLAATPNPEFVGSESRMELIAYQQARQQLAAHIRRQMLNEFFSFGGIVGVNRWFYQAINDNKDKILDMCAHEEQYSFIKKWEDKSGKKYRNMGFDRKFPLSPEIPSWKQKVQCPITYNAATLFYHFKFENWKQMAEVFGEKHLPKIVKGWQKQRMGPGNHLLEVTDPVWYIGTPMESGEIARNQRLWTKETWQHELFFNKKNFPEGTTIPETALTQSTWYDFEFSVALSKRGLAKLQKLA